MNMKKQNVQRQKQRSWRNMEKPRNIVSRSCGTSLVSSASFAASDSMVSSKTRASKSDRCMAGSWRNFSYLFILKLMTLDDISQISTMFPYVPNMFTGVYSNHIIPYICFHVGFKLLTFRGFPWRSSSEAISTSHMRSRVRLSAK